MPNFAPLGNYFSAKAHRAALCASKTASNSIDKRDVPSRCVEPIIFTGVATEATSKESRMIRILTPFLVLLALTACETVDGMGQDVSNAGGAISDGAEDVQNDM